jgi:hypothetical protein
MSHTLAGLLREFNVTVFPISRNHRRAARETCAGKTLAHIFQLYGYNHTRMVVMSIVESKPNKRALIGPVIWAVSDVLKAYPAWFGDPWFQIMDTVDLAALFEQASANRRIAQPRALIASLLFAQMRQHFPDQARPLKTGRPKRPADQPAQRMAA